MEHVNVDYNKKENTYYFQYNSVNNYRNNKNIVKLKNGNTNYFIKKIELNHINNVRFIYCTFIIEHIISKKIYNIKYSAPYKDVDDDYAKIISYFDRKLEKVDPKDINPKDINVDNTPSIFACAESVWDFFVEKLKIFKEVKLNNFEDYIYMLKNQDIIFYPPDNNGVYGTIDASDNNNILTIDDCGNCGSFINGSMSGITYNTDADITYSNETVKPKTLKLRKKNKKNRKYIPEKKFYVSPFK